MGRTFRDKVRAMNSDLKRDMDALTIKERKTFHRATEAHGRHGKQATRYERRQTKIDLRREIW